jgi:hypothetical protein
MAARNLTTKSTFKNHQQAVRKILFIFVPFVAVLRQHLFV